MLAKGSGIGAKGCSADDRSCNSPGRSRPRGHLHRDLSSCHRHPLPLARLGRLHRTHTPLRHQLPRLDLPTPRHVLRRRNHANHVTRRIWTTHKQHSCGTIGLDMGVVHINFPNRFFLLVSPIPSSLLVSPSRKGRRPTQRPQRHGSLQSPTPGTTTRSSPPRKTTMTPPRRHQMTALETETQPADPHRHIGPRTRGRTRPLRPRGRLDLQQRVRESRQEVP